MKFSIRDLLLVTVIVALALGWWVDHRRLAKRDLERTREYILPTEEIQRLLLEKEIESLRTSSAPATNPPKD